MSHRRGQNHCRVTSPWFCAGRSGASWRPSHAWPPLR